MEVLTTGRCTRCGKVFAFAADEVPSECPFCSRVLTRRWSGIHKQQLMNT